MSTTRKLLWSVLLVAVLGGLAAFGAFSAFSATTSNDNNQFAAGTVTIGNNATTPLYNVTNAKPGVASTDHCIKITYSGSLSANVNLYRSALTGGTGLAPYLTVTVTKGTGSQENCSDFSGSTTVYSSDLNSFPTTFAGGLSLTNAGGSTTWSNGDTVTYKFSAQVQNNNAAAGLSTGTHSFIWEADNT